MPPLLILPEMCDVQDLAQAKAKNTQKVCQSTSSTDGKIIDMPAKRGLCRQSDQVSKK